MILLKFCYNISNIENLSVLNCFFLNLIIFLIFLLIYFQLCIRFRYSFLLSILQHLHPGLKSNNPFVCYRFVYLKLVSSDKVENLAQQINSLQIEKKKIEEEFGVQRAKMKELYLQKESEFLCACLGSGIYNCAILYSSCFTS